MFYPIYFINILKYYTAVGENVLLYLKICFWKLLNDKFNVNGGWVKRSEREKGEEKVERFVEREGEN